jgi:hypothetical protein
MWAILYIASTVNIMGQRTGLLYDEQVWSWVFRHVFIALSADPDFANREYRLRYWKIVLKNKIKIIN